MPQAVSATPIAHMPFGSQQPLHDGPHAPPLLPVPELVLPLAPLVVPLPALLPLPVLVALVPPLPPLSLTPLALPLLAPPLEPEDESGLWWSAVLPASCGALKKSGAAPVAHAEPSAAAGKRTRLPVVTSRVA
jgi:hypothetical protein